MSVETLLIDATNYDQYQMALLSSMRNAGLVGIDVETQDSNRHPGLTALCKYKADGTRPANGKLVFDMQRTVMTGLSLYIDGDDKAYYFNLNHADVENRIPWEKMKFLLDAKPAGASWIAHNAPYELTSFRCCYDFALPDMICTMQMAVSAFGPDEYDLSEFIQIGQGGIASLIPQIMPLLAGYDPSTREMPPKLEEVLGKIIAKESTAAHSYNGLVAEAAYSYGLKALVKKFFGHQMGTFAETLGTKAHMGQLTGAETAHYGAEDAYWAVRLFHRLLEFMSATNPSVIKTFFEQENPMIHVFSDLWANGMVVNDKAIFERRDEERVNMAQILRDMKVTVNKLLPFDPEPHEGLLKDNWYAKGYKKYRAAIEKWAQSPDTDDVFQQCYQVRGPVTNAWATELNAPESTGPNFSHYMPQRTLMYDLLREKTIVSHGKIQSDGEARGKLKDRLTDEISIELIDALNKISSVEQRVKLYLTPYTQLTDPDSGKLYPNVTSMLATRRMAARDPNPMQLAKRGESTYVRGFFQGDYSDHVVLSVDWSGIELVEIGEFSGDPEFVNAFKQIPHGNLHAGAAADILAVDVPGLTEDKFFALRDHESEEAYRDHFGQEMANYNRLFTDLKGQPLPIKKAYSYWRTEVGKGANFNYFYSGFLGTIGDRMGWDINKTGKATERYRERFAVAEKWRTDLIAEGMQNGFVTLPDNHRRVRFEATELWREYFGSKFILDNPEHDDMVARYNSVWGWVMKKIQTRANNQLVNAYIQGSCATLAKRSVLRINDKFKALGWSPREARFMMPVHDELVYSVHKDLVVEAIHTVRGTMVDHPDMFQKCLLDASPSIGLTFEPWSADRAPTGQIELHELPNIGIGEVNARASDDEVRSVVDYLFSEQHRIAA